MGFIEEAGAAQHYRDARILPIYEGTNGIQALDLFTRKLLRDHGKAMKTLIRELQDGLPPAGDALAALRPPLVTALAALAHATAWLLDDGAKSIATGARSGARRVGKNGVGTWKSRGGAEN